MFDYMTISALIEEKIFIVHGGLSPSIHSLNEIRSLNRVTEIGSISYCHSWIGFLTDTKGLLRSYCGRTQRRERVGDPPHEAPATLSVRT